MDTLKRGTLMRDNTPLLSFDLSSGYLEQHAGIGFPFLLRNERTLERIEQFLASRLPATERRDYREICAIAGIHPLDTAEWQRRTHCLSVDDPFWVRPLGSSLTRAEVDPRVHSFAQE